CPARSPGRGDQASSSICPASRRQSAPASTRCSPRCPIASISSAARGWRRTQSSAQPSVRRREADKRSFVHHAKLNCRSQFHVFQCRTGIFGEWSFLHVPTKSEKSGSVGKPMSVVQIVERETDVRAAMREIGAKARAAARE